VQRLQRRAQRGVEQFDAEFLGLQRFDIAERSAASAAARQHHRRWQQRVRRKGRGISRRRHRFVASRATAQRS
jgi:hypothetical protein